MQGITNGCDEWDVSDCEAFGELSVPFWCSDEDIDGNFDDWSERITEFFWQACYEQLFCRSICRSFVEPWVVWQESVSCLAVFVVLVDRRKLSFDYSTKQKWSKKGWSDLPFLQQNGWLGMRVSQAAGPHQYKGPPQVTLFIGIPWVFHKIGWYHFSTAEVTVTKRCEAT